MTVLPGAEPVDLPGGDVGVLLSHGFTGTTQSIRPWAEHLAAAGLTVVAPRLPGHGTRWQDMNRTGWDDWYGEVDRAFTGLRARCSTVFAMGLSMGGTLVLRLAEQRAHEVAGLVVVNASLATQRRDAKLLPVASRLVRSFPGIASDIAKPGVTELAYDRLPLKAAYSLQKAWPLVRGDLHRISCPVLVYRSAVDHVVEPVSGRALVAGLAGGLVEERVLADSYHVATLDHDAPVIFTGSLDFVRRTGRGGPVPLHASAG
ncbi:MAG TPA: alpha/beta fold hydrolase [Mycobacteriales bacterium]|nr:alpha/beta fold hydrolase [Mycobacteriales bacterium]